MGTRKNRLSKAVLTSTHNLCFRAKIRINVYPCKPQFYYIKVGCKGVYITRTCFRDACLKMMPVILQFASVMRFFVLMLHNVPVNSYGYVGSVAYNFMGLLPYIEMYDTPSPAIQYLPSKQLRLICRDGPT